MKLQASIYSKFIKHSPFSYVLMSILIFSLMSFSTSAYAQQAEELSLADLLIGLRSNKVPLIDRNKILAEAVRERGVSFEINARNSKRT